MKTLFITTLILCSVVAHSQRKVVYKHPNGQKKEEGVLVRGEKDGKWTEWREDGKLAKKVLYNIGKKEWEENYSRQGNLSSEIDYLAAPGQAIVKTYDNRTGVCWHEHYSEIRGNRIKGSYNSRGQIGYRIARHVDGSGLHYFTHRNQIEKKYNIIMSLPSYWWNKEGKLSTVQFGSNNLRWHDNGQVGEVRGFFDNTGTNYYYRWDENGVRMNNAMKPVPDDQVKFDYSLAKNLIKEKYTGGVPDGKWENYYANGQIWYKQEFDKGKPTGAFEAWHFNGNKHVEATLEKGIFHGEYKEWYADGKLKVVGLVNMGVKDGQWKYWNKDGMLQKEENFFEKVPHGMTREYHYQTGDLTSEVNYVKGKKEGVGVEWYGKDKLKKIADYRDGYANGRIIEYYENGNLKSEKYYGFGVYRSYHQDGTLSSIGCHQHNNGNTFSAGYDQQGVPTHMSYDWGNGTTASVRWSRDVKTVYYTVNKAKQDPSKMPLAFLEDPKTIINGEYGNDVNGLKHGLWTTYYPNNQKWVEAQYNHGRLNGVCKVWSLDGKLIEESSFSNDVRHGWTRYWDHEGRKVKEEYYENGKKEGDWKEWHPASEHLRYELTYKNNKINGVYMTYNSDGTVYSYVTYKDGVKEGLNVAYNYKTRKKVAEFDYSKGERHGKSVTYNADEKVEWKGQYAYGKQHGEWQRIGVDGTVIERKYYDYGDLLVEPLDLECQCESNYNNTGKIGFFPMVNDLATYMEVKKAVSEHFIPDPKIYDHLFYRNYQFSNSSRGNARWMAMDVIAFDSLSLELKGLPGVKWVLNPCLKGNQYSDTYLNISSQHPIKNYIYGFEEERFDHKASSYYQVACAIASPNNEEMIDYLIEGVAYLYDGEPLDTLISMMHKHGLASLKMVGVADREELIKSFEGKEEELDQFVIKQFFNQGKVAKGSDKRYVVEQNLNAIFSSAMGSMTLDQLDRYMKKEWRVDTGVKQLATDFPVSLLKQWDDGEKKPMLHQKKEIPARLLFGISSMEYTTDDGVMISGAHSFCFTEAVIGNTKTTISFDDAKVLVNRNDSKYVNQENELMPKVDQGIFVPEAKGKLYSGNKPLNLKFRKVFLRGDLITGAILMDQSKSQNEQVIKEATSRFTKVKEGKLDGQKVLYFIYRQ